jgi:hypothetical protein
MFDKLKQWAQGNHHSTRQDLQVLTQWAQANGCVPKPVSGQAKGMVIEWPTLPGRLEWGPSQRPYIQGHELRWRAEGVPGPDAQMVCLSKAMVMRLETDQFDQISDDQQKTVIDLSMPDEVRWLAMLPKAHWLDMPSLGAHFVMMCRHEPLLTVMRNPTVCQALLSAQDTWWTDEITCVLTHNRGWMTLRMSGNGLNTEILNETLAMFRVIVQLLKFHRNHT